MPNERVTCLHVVNMTLFLSLVVISTATEILMVKMYSSNRQIVDDGDVAKYLRNSFMFEITFAFGYLFEVSCSLIIGHLIIWYSQENKGRNQHIDPFTELKVPSLVFVFNQQQILNAMTGVRSETPE